MGKEISSPLSEIVRRALKHSPADGKASALKRRFEDATEELVVLVDNSGSMLDPIGGSGRSKWEHARVALADVLIYHPEIRVAAFSSNVRLLSGAALPEPSGGTNYLPALELAAAYRPRKTIIISDGQPTDYFFDQYGNTVPNAQPLLDFAARMTGAIDTIYCGPDNAPEIEFLRRLSRSTAGSHVTWDGYRQQLSGAIRGLIAAPLRA